MALFGKKDAAHAGPSDPSDSGAGDHQDGLAELAGQLGQLSSLQFETLNNRAAKAANHIAVRFMG